MRQPSATGDVPFGIGRHCLDQQGVIDRHPFATLKKSINVRQNGRVLIGRAPQHHAVHMRKMRGRLVKADNAAIDADEPVGIGLFQTIDAVIVERRDFPVLLGLSPCSHALRACTQSASAPADQAASASASSAIPVS